MYQGCKLQELRGGGMIFSELGTKIKNGRSTLNRQVLTFFLILFTLKIIYFPIYNYGEINNLLREGDDFRKIYWYVLKI